MAELYKVIECIDKCTTQKVKLHCNDCAYHNLPVETDCFDILMRDALELLKEYKRQDECPCNHCMEWECDEVCDEYKKWHDVR